MRFQGLEIHFFKRGKRGKEKMGDVRMGHIRGLAAKLVPEDSI
ncbi:hypothetical protein RMSM_01646 [Rhodopirellula maiorica SM1]|uniref:Uncharacterized protein n=1 Tax=Rhodopirellula maiorica SM1 TaxID=1265738 RepID=M5S5E0_9BACT|nr:hypothetical protein RMSM_01646 [Rhodopirellula maiorica SM1]